MGNANKAAVVGINGYGTAGPGQAGMILPEITVEVLCSTTSVAVGEPVYCQMSQFLAFIGRTATGDAYFDGGWVRTAPGGSTPYLLSGVVGICREVLGDETLNAVAHKRIVVQLQGVCDIAKVDTTTAANSPLTFDTAGELDVAVAGDRVVALALAADTAGVAPVVLLGPWSGFMPSLV
jgi:hypothetical protein